MIGEGDRVAVALSGGKDSLTLLEALRLLQARAPVEFSLCAFTIEQGKFVRPLEPLAAWLRSKQVPWTCFRDAPSVRLRDEQPGHGCDLCSRYRRRAVYEIARGLGANVIAFGHTADDLCEALLRNALFTGRLSALPAVARSRDGEFRLIRPLLFVPEDLTRRFAAELRAPLIPCACSQRNGTVRQQVRALLADLETRYPNIRASLLAAASHLDPARLLDRRYLPAQAAPALGHNEELV